MFQYVLLRVFHAFQCVVAEFSMRFSVCYNAKCSACVSRYFPCVSACVADWEGRVFSRPFIAHAAVLSSVLSG